MKLGRIVPEIEILGLFRTSEGLWFPMRRLLKKRSREILTSMLMVESLMLVVVISVLFAKVRSIPEEKLLIKHVDTVTLAWFDILIPTPVVSPWMVLLLQSRMVLVARTINPAPLQERFVSIRDGRVILVPHEVRTS